MNDIKILFEISYITTDNSLKYKLVYITGRKVFGRTRDKTYPKVTQCLLFTNGLLTSFGQVVKCDSDIDNLEYAVKLVTKKVMKDIWFKSVRKEIWAQLKANRF